MRVKLGSLVAGILAVLVAHSPVAHADALDDIMASGKLRVGTDTGFPPYGYLDSSLKPAGSDVETAQLLAKDWGLTLEFVNTVSSTRVPNLTSKRADIIISSLAKTPERAQAIDFSIPFAVIQAVVGAQKKVEMTSPDSFAGKTISITRGGVPDRNMSPEADAKGYKLRRYDDDATLVTAGVTGQAEIVAASGNIIHEIASRNPDFEQKFVQASYDLHIGLRKNEPRLQEKLDAWVRENLKNGKLNAIYKKHHFNELPQHLSKN